MTLEPKPMFVIWALPWDAGSGGNIALHALCDRLNELGYPAAIWPLGKTPLPRSFRGLRAFIDYFAKGRSRNFDFGPFPRRIAGWQDLRTAVLIYPEIVSGNPVRAKRFVRWLLYKPGKINGNLAFGRDDLFFFFNPAFDDPSLHAGRDHLLRVTYQIDCYHQWNFGERSGSCVLVRKGKNRPLDRHPADAILVDDLSHEEAARIFNQTRYLYCYDPHTYLAVYAAKCGCIPIVIPQAGVSEEEWEPVEGNRLGLAYGEQRIPWAIETQGRLLEHLQQVRAEEDETIHRFVRICRERFPRRF